MNNFKVLGFGRERNQKKQKKIFYSRSRDLFQVTVNQEKNFNIVIKNLYIYINNGIIMLQNIHQTIKLFKIKYFISFC
mgnify:CR=1 FL=1